LRIGEDGKDPPIDYNQIIRSFTEENFEFVQNPAEFTVEPFHFTLQPGGVQRITVIVFFIAILKLIGCGLGI
jgi:hypothetical protein